MARIVALPKLTWRTCAHQARGYRCTIVMPDDQAAEKQQLLRKFGASVVLVKPSAIVNDEHYCNVARRLAAGTEGGFFADQFETLSNYRAHLTTTGPEIWRQTGGKVDAFVMAAGTRRSPTPPTRLVWLC